MVFVGTVLWIIDNSGAKKVRCIKTLNNGLRDYSGPGDVVIASMIFGLNNKNVVRGRIYKVVIASTRYGVMRLGGEKINFQNNNAVMIKVDKMPIGTRILNAVMLELRYKGYMKIISLALLVI